MTLTGIILIVVLAIVVGALVGLAPGIPAFVGIILLAPLFGNIAPEYLLIFFASFICVTQYYGSVSAILFGIPGEPSSLPVLERAKQFRQSSSVVKAIRATAYGSFVASMIAIVLFYILIVIAKEFWYVLFSTKVVAIFLVMLMLLLVLENKNIIRNFLFLVIGLTVSNFHETPLAAIACGSLNLCGLVIPLDTNLILLGMYCVPLLFVNLIGDKSSWSKQATAYTPSWKNIHAHFKNSALYGTLGFFIGFMPGLGMTLSSNISAGIAKVRNRFKSLSIMTAAESANNAAAVSCLVPFLILGIPITPSEFLISSMMDQRFYRINLQVLDQLVTVGSITVSTTTIILVSLLIGNIVCFALAGNFVRFYQRLLSAPSIVYENVIRLFIVISVVMVLTNSSVSLIISLITLVVFSVIGYWAHCRNINTLPLVIPLVIGPFIFNKFMSAYYLWR